MTIVVYFAHLAVFHVHQYKKKERNLEGDGLLDRDLMRAEASFFRALGDETRLNILLLLKTGEQNVTEICQKIEKDQSTISHHLACLRNCGLVKTRKEGKSVIYSLNGKDMIYRVLELTDRHVKDTIEGILKCEVVR